MSHSLERGQAPRPRKALWRNALLIVLVFLAAAALALALSRCAAGPGGSAATRAGRRPSVTVGVAKASVGEVPITLNELGTVTPAATVQVNAQVSGPLTQVVFKEGDLVRRGQLLAQIDPRPFKVAVDQAKGQLARDEATLAGARRDLARYQALLAQNSIARQTVEDQAATVKQDEGTVAADRAAVASAELNLAYTRIVAPVAGRVGLRQVDVGNLITANSATPIVVVTEVEPIDVVFAVPEDGISAIAAHPGYGVNLPVTAYDRGGGAVLAQGTLIALDNLVDTTTGTVKAKARFANANGALFPNQFVNVTILVDTLKNQVIAPTTAVRHGPQGDYVYVLQADRTVKMTPVKVGPGTGETTSIVSGLAAGQTVITEGGDRLRDGAQVTLPGQAPAQGGPGDGGRRRHGGGRWRGGQGGGGGTGGGGGG